MNVRPRPSHGRALIPLSYRSQNFSGGERAALTSTSAVARPAAETLAEAAGLEPAHAMRGDLANRCHTIRRRLRNICDCQLPIWFLVCTRFLCKQKMLVRTDQSAIGNRKSAMIWRKVKESNPRDVLLGLVFKTSCAPPRATFQIGWDARI